MEILRLVLGALALLWGMLFAGAPAIGWLNTVLLAAFLVAFSMFYNPAAVQAPAEPQRLAYGGPGVHL